MPEQVFSEDWRERLPGRDKLLPDKVPLQVPVLHGLREMASCREYKFQQALSFILCKGLADEGLNLTDQKGVPAFPQPSQDFNLLFCKRPFRFARRLGKDLHLHEE